MYVGNTYGATTYKCSNADHYPTPGPGPFDIYCGCSDSVGSFITVKHIGPNADYLALSEIQVLTQGTAPPPGGVTTLTATSSSVAAAKREQATRTSRATRSRCACWTRRASWTEHESGAEPLGGCTKAHA